MLKKIIKKLILGKKYDSESYIKYLRRCGIAIGKDTRIFDPPSTLIDTQHPHMLTIGDNVRITKGVIILTHDYSWSVIATMKGRVYGGISQTIIGNNVFIGMNSIVLKGSIIGDNVIIGAGSVIHGRVERNSVYAGNPAKRIGSIEDYEEKLKLRQKGEMKDLVRLYRSRFGTIPSKEELQEYFFYYENRSKDLTEHLRKLIRRTGSEDKILKQFNATEPVVNGYEELLKGFH